MADEDNFDIDIYGDGEGMDEDSKAFYKQEMEKDIALKETKEEEDRKLALKQEAQGKQDTQETQETSTTSFDKSAIKKETDAPESNDERKPQLQQGTKRKGETDERRIDAGATNALLLSELHWWTTEDDVRGWINDAGAEDELKEITFSEHKVNGKSKGQVFLEFASPQASTATKHKIEKLSTGPTNNRKFTVAFHSASSNPFKSLPKDAPGRAKDDRPQRSTSTPYSGPTHNEYSSNRGNFRGRGGYNSNRGAGYNQGGYNNNRNFSGPANSFNDRSGYAGGNNANGYNPRGGGMLPMRGGRGGLGGGMGGGMMGMPMNMMMGNPMGMMAGMGPQGFGGNVPQFNPMFGQQQGNWGPGYGNNNKRQRQD